MIGQTYRLLRRVYRMVDVVQKVCIYLCHIYAYHLRASFPSKLLADDQQNFLAECSLEVDSISPAFFNISRHLNQRNSLAHTHIKEPSFKLGQYPSSSNSYGLAINILPQAYLLLLPLYMNYGLARSKLWAGVGYYYAWRHTVGARPAGNPDPFRGTR
jgi:hypothetical protein